jgi:phage gp29-like protein
MRDKLGIPEPQPDEEVLVAPAPSMPFGGAFGDPAVASLHSRLPRKRTGDEIAELARAAEGLAEPSLNEMIDHIKTALQSAMTLEDVRGHLANLNLDTTAMTRAVQLARVIAKLSGRTDIANGR